MGLTLKEAEGLIAPADKRILQELDLPAIAFTSSRNTFVTFYMMFLHICVQLHTYLIVECDIKGVLL